MVVGKWATWRAPGGGYNVFHTPEKRRQWELQIAQTPQRFAQVTVDPRAVYAQTWPRAQALLGNTFRPSTVSIHLYLEDLDEQLPAPLWAIAYSSEDLRLLTFFIDARTGELLKQNVYHYGDSTP